MENTTHATSRPRINARTHHADAAPGRAVTLFQIRSLGSGAGAATMGNDVALSRLPIARALACN